MGTPEKAALFGSVAGYVGAIPASMLALKHALSKHLESLSTIATTNNS
jgi:hypothetical protein